MMTEWELQSTLTERWASEGLKINDCLQFLVAWEVMSPSWRINDAKIYWSEPSIDFIFADKHMTLTAVELKRKISGIKPGWLVLSQVTHRVVELLRTISQEKLESAYMACWSGDHGRIQRPKHLPSLSERHRQFFALSSPIEFMPHEIRRCVAALQFGRSWPAILRDFNQLAGSTLQARIRTELTSKAAKREVDRLISISATDLNILKSSVVSFVISPLV